MNVFNYALLAVSLLGGFASVFGPIGWPFAWGLMFSFSVLAIVYGPRPVSKMRRVANANHQPNENGYYWSVNAALEDDGSTCFMLLTDDQVKDAMSRAAKQSEDVYVTPEEV